MSAVNAVAAKGFIRFRADAAGVVLECHGSETMAPGRTAAQVVGVCMSQLVPTEVSALMLGAIDECLATQSLVDLNYSIELDDGVHVRQARLVPAGMGQVFGIVSDDTEHQITNARRIHLAEILEASTDYVATTDLDGRILYANAAFRARFGIPSVADIETTSYNLFSFFTPASRTRFLSDGLAVLWSVGRWTGEIEGLDADGVAVPLWQAAIAHLGPDGHPEYFSGIARDITEMKVAEAELRDSEERFRALIASGTDVILVLTAEGRITYASPAIERILGYIIADLLGTLAFDLIHPDDLPTALEGFQAAFVGQNSPDGGQFRVRHVDGSWRWTESFTTNHLTTPGVNGFIVNARDITARHEANEIIERGSMLLASVMGAAASEAIFVTDQTATLVAFSRGAEVLLGYEAAEVIGKLHPAAFHQRDEVAEVAAGLGISSEALFLHAPADGKSIVREWTFVRRDGSTFDGSLTVSPRFDADEALCGFLYTARDITDRRRNEAALTQRANHDQLTGLANRASLQATLARAVDEPGWSQPGRVLLALDLDHFKAVNDRLGHAAGDAVLVGVSNRLVENLRDEDMPVRLGGDEFVVLFGATVTAAIAARIAERIVRALAVPFDFEGQMVCIGVSIGLAISDATIGPDGLLLAADRAAYAAKREGRGRVVEAAVRLN